MKWIRIDGKITPETPVDTGRRLESNPLLLRSEVGKFLIGKYCRSYPKSRGHNRMTPFFSANIFDYGPFTHYAVIEGPIVE